MELYFYPGYTYAAYRSTEINQVKIFIYYNFYNFFIHKVPSVTFYESRPLSLVYHSHEFHVMDLKVEIFTFRKYLIYFHQPFECHCHNISFGSVNDVLAVSSIHEIPQTSDEHSAFSDHEVKQLESLNIESGKIKVIDFTYS